MNLRFRPFFIPSIIVILGAVSYSPALKAQDLTNIKPTPQSEVVPQPPKTPRLETQNNPSNLPPERNLVPQPSSDSSTPTSCQGGTPSVGQPDMTKPSDVLNPSENRTPMNQDTNPLRPSPTIPQSQPLSPNR